MSAIMKIEPLTAENYDTWKMQMEAILVKNDVWAYVNGTKVRPSSGTDAMEWTNKDAKAKADIVLSMSTSELNVIRGLETSREVWLKIESTFQSKGPARKAILLKKIILSRLKEGDNVRTHLTEFFEAVAKLKEIGLVVNEEVLTILLLYSLPESFGNFRCAIETRDELPDPEILRVKILEEYESRKASDNTEQNVMYARRSRFRQNTRVPHDSREDSRNNKTESQAGAGQGKPKCFRCGKIGHIAKRCLAKYPANLQVSARQVEDNDNESVSSEHARGDTAMLNTVETVLFNRESVNGVEWCLDSGCTAHMCTEKTKFEKIESVHKTLNLANSESTSITGAGNVRMAVSNGKRETNVNFEKVYYVSDLRTNLLSVSKITDRGYEVHFREKDATVTGEHGEIIFRADRIGNLYYVRRGKDAINENDAARKGDNVAMSVNHTKSEIDEWHYKLGHLNERDLKSMAKSGVVHGLKLKIDQTMSKCEVCIREKQTRAPFPRSEGGRTKNVLEIVHSDVCGPMRTASHSGAKYFVTFIDDRSRWCEVIFVKNKSDVLSAFKKYKAAAETLTGRKIKALQSDNGTEYCNKEFDQFLEQNGIARRLSTPHTPQQNGVAERKNRTLVEMARCMMRQADVSPVFWAEAVNTACYVRNRCVTKSLDGQVPYKLWKGKIPTVIYFQIFGSRVFVSDKNPQKGKFDSRSEEGIFVGYSNESKAYRVWLPKSRKVIVSRDVKFLNESAFDREYQEFLEDEKPDQTETKGHEQEEELIEDKAEEHHAEGPQVVIKERHHTEVPRDRDVIVRAPKRRATEGSTPLPTRLQPPKRGRGRPMLLRTGSVGRPRKLYHQAANNNDGNDGEDSEDSDDEGLPDETPDDDDAFMECNLTITHDPTTWQEAEQSDDVEDWRTAMEDEYLAQIRNNTWEIVSRPQKRKVIGSRFVFCTKDSGLVTKKKVRLVAKGCSQRAGEDFHETYSPVARSTSIRLLAALSAELGLQIHQMDVVTAYLNGELEEDVYMEVPEQLCEVLTKIIAGKRVGSNAEIIRKEDVIRTAKRWLHALNAYQDSVCLLKKALYGLRQSGLQWYRRLVSRLKQMGMQPTDQDPCMFTSRRKNCMMIIAIYVDDIVIATNDPSWMKEVKRNLAESFEMKDLGPVNNCLGIEFQQDEADYSVILTQRQYTEAILERFGMQDCKPARTPIDTNVQLTKPSRANEKIMRQYPFQRLIGALMYLAVSTRPDIAYAVNFLSQFNTNYSTEHWLAAKRILRYLRGTESHGLMYQKSDIPLYGVVDADWGANAVDRRSYSGYAFILAGAAICWEARKQRTVALSSVEAEYMAMSEATKEAIYLQGLLRDTTGPCDGTILFNDNQGAQRLVYSTGVHHSRTKHIDLRHHFIRDHCASGAIELQYMSTNDMPADILTKGLTGHKHIQCQDGLGMIELRE